MYIRDDVLMKGHKMAKDDKTEPVLIKFSKDELKQLDDVVVQLEGRRLPVIRKFVADGVKKAQRKAK